GRAMSGLLTSSRRLYDQLLADEPIDCEWQAKGLLYVLQTPRGMEHHAATARLLRESFGGVARRLDRGEVAAVEPALRAGLAGGWWYEADAHLRPDRLLASWRRVLEARGVVVRERCPAVRFLRAAAGRARAVLTPDGEVPADAFVVAAGAWTPLLNRM